MDSYWTLFWACLAAIGTWATVAAAFAVILVQNRSAKKLTCLQLFLHVAAQYDSTEMNQRRSRLATQLLLESHPLEIDDTLLVFFENVALMLKKRLLDPDLVHNTFSFDVISYHAALETYVKATRQRFGDDTIYEHFDWLVCEMKRVDDSRSDSTGLLGTHDSVMSFLRMEKLRSAP